MRVVVPDINRLLPVYVFDKYEGFTVKTIPDMSSEEIEQHIGQTAEALRRVCEQGADMVLANHVMLSPVIGVAHVHAPAGLAVLEHDASVGNQIASKPALL